MEPIQYPKWKYHKTDPAVIVQDPEEEMALGQGWAETPFLDPEDDPIMPDWVKPKRGRKPKTEAQS